MHDLALVGKIQTVPAPAFRDHHHFSAKETRLKEASSRALSRQVKTIMFTRHEIFENEFYRSTYPSGRQKFSAGWSQEDSWSHFSTADRFPFYQAGADQIRPIFAVDSADQNSDPVLRL